MLEPKRTEAAEGAAEDVVVTLHFQQTRAAAPPPSPPDVGLVEGGGEKGGQPEQAWTGGLATRDDRFPPGVDRSQQPTSWLTCWLMRPR